MEEYNWQHERHLGALEWVRACYSGKIYWGDTIDHLRKKKKTQLTYKTIVTVIDWINMKQASLTIYAMQVQ